MTVTSWRTIGEVIMSQLLTVEGRPRPDVVAEIIDTKELASHWQLPVSWIREYTRPDRTGDPIPHVRLGKYVRFEWGPALEQWFASRRNAASTARVTYRTQSYALKAGGGPPAVGLSVR